ncbi:hypothetical protein BGW38_004919 [Lunasporangiospora selenospora]|uniref:Senescence domain-containing protein n=1 Tax=Lunasporangiospora selenospora TaxID=979761 RepID=A0A9P6KB77_9FUNG|nr:hypothetical protein BGW38_004919 [Lunasporangiospora selenospora]
MRNFACAILNSAGVIIQAAEESFSIVTGPAISATQELAGRALGPDAKEMVAEALDSLKHFTLVYFDGAGISRRAFLQTSRTAALRTAQEVRDGKIKMRERKKEEKALSPAAAAVAAAAASPVTADSSESDSAPSKTEGIVSKAHHVKELIFSYFGKSGDSEVGSPAAGSSTKGSPSASGSITKD